MIMWYKDKNIRVRGTYHDFHTTVGDELSRYLLSLIRSELYDDFKERCMDTAVQCIRKGDIAMPFNQMTPEGKTQLTKGS
jgi:hypothetical protein